jgi:hypothetical protein
MLVRDRSNTIPPLPTACNKKVFLEKLFLLQQLSESESTYQGTTRKLVGFNLQ